MGHGGGFIGTMCDLHAYGGKPLLWTRGGVHRSNGSPCECGRLGKAFVVIVAFLLKQGLGVP